MREKKSHHGISSPQIVLLSMIKFGPYEVTDSHGLMIVGALYRMKPLHK